MSDGPVDACCQGLAATWDGVTVRIELAPVSRYVLLAKTVPFAIFFSLFFAGSVVLAIVLHAFVGWLFTGLLAVTGVITVVEHRRSRHSSTAIIATPLEIILFGPKSRPVFHIDKTDRYLPASVEPLLWAPRAGRLVLDPIPTPLRLNNRRRVTLAIDSCDRLAEVAILIEAARSKKEQLPVRGAFEVIPLAAPATIEMTAQTP